MTGHKEAQEVLQICDWIDEHGDRLFLVENNADFRQWEARETELKRELQRAVWELTRDVNCRDNCGLVRTKVARDIARQVLSSRNLTEDSSRQ